MSKWSNPDFKLREERKVFATTHRINLGDRTATAVKAVIGKPLNITNGIRYIFNGWNEFHELPTTKSSVSVSVLKDLISQNYFLSPIVSKRLIFYKVNSYPTCKKRFIYHNTHIYNSSFTPLFLF